MDIGRTYVAENCLYYASGYYNFRMRRLHCQPDDKRYSFKDYVEMDLFMDVFTYFPYNTFVAVYAFVIIFNILLDIIFIAGGVILYLI